MKKRVVLSGIVVSVLLLGTIVCRAEKWDKNDYAGNGVESGFYDADSIKVQNKTVSWTEKYLFTPESVENDTKALSKYKACKNGIEQYGNVAQFQVDYQIENNKKFRGVSKRYYNKDNKLLCTDKDLGPDDFNAGWHDMVRHSPIEKAYYDLVTNYKIVIK